MLFVYFPCKWNFGVLYRMCFVFHHCKYYEWTAHMILFRCNIFVQQYYDHAMVNVILLLLMCYINILVQCECNFMIQIHGIGCVLNRYFLQEHFKTNLCHDIFVIKVTIWMLTEKSRLENFVRTEPNCESAAPNKATRYRIG